MDKLVLAILKYGLLPAFLCVIIFLIIQDPTRAYKLRTLLMSPFYKLFKWFKREFIANEVAGTLTHFFTKVLSMKTSYPLKFKINWVKTDDNPILKSGKLIIRMRKDEDQTKNILTATRYALTKIVCPNFRHNIQPAYVTAIDFTFLHKLADGLGNHGKAIFRQYFLNPEVENDPQFVDILKKFLVLDKSGLFSSILINELDHVGEGLFGDADTNDRTGALIKFVEFLTHIAEREIGEDNQLEHFSETFKVSIILLARAIMSSRKGLYPYLKRLNINLEKGSDSIYVVAYPPAFDFLGKFVKVLDGNQRVSIDRIDRSKDKILSKSNVSICCLRRNKLYSNETFLKKVQASNMVAGMNVDGSVFDCSTEIALVTFLGVDATIVQSDCSWLSFHTCTDILSVGKNYPFTIKNIDLDNCNITLSLKAAQPHPWSVIQHPLVNDIIDLEIVFLDSVNLKCLYRNTIEVIAPIKELSWNGEDYDTNLIAIGKTINCKVLSVDDENKTIVSSPRALIEDPWPKIHEALVIGTNFNGKVLQIDENFVKVSLENGLVGRIPGSSFTKAGYEYANYMANLVIGQVLEVIVTKVFIGQQWIRLDLKRNVRPTHPPNINPPNINTQNKPKKKHQTKKV
ncbi:hypothetical protein JN11_03928 [Mucilaginibacter frigoritolerans]|uniref:S1 motif domain-containing protein n=1 Tax=Mucilaginibacter frigoritolerans TaxID=652788 RepID=A0A562TTC2_9SPHI|nr:hypothetical protein [Mucilaginibacter frigoritolerans]TWI96815.1 hypothetical protein JN11_03928 [Mucilaginibacter frigoritolerans]